MKLGMNIKLGSDSIKFIDTCERAGIRAIRLVSDRDGLSHLHSVAAHIESKGMMAALSVMSVCNVSMVRDCSLFVDEAADLYEAVGPLFPKEISLGVVLPVGASQLEAMIPAVAIKNTMSILSNIVKQSGHKVVLPMSFGDAVDQRWNGVSCDVIELDMMLSESVDFNPLLERVLAQMNKPFWFGKSGIVGGYTFPSEQVKVIRKLMSSSIGAEYSFLWSEPNDSRWAWSIDGMAVIDILGSSINQATSQRIPTGDANLASIKASLR